MDEFDESAPVSRSKPSKTPSWIMLGFILGALFVWALPRRESVTPPSLPPAPQKLAPPTVILPPRVTDVEAFFAEWGQHALWVNDKAYIAAYDVVSHSYRDCYEVLRVGDSLYFRSIDRPRDMRVLQGLPAESPLQFFNPISEPRGLFTFPSRPSAEGPTR